MKIVYFYRKIDKARMKQQERFSTIWTFGRFRFGMWLIDYNHFDFWSRIHKVGQLKTNFATKIRKRVANKAYVGISSFWFPNASSIKYVTQKTGFFTPFSLCNGICKVFRRQNRIGSKVLIFHGFHNQTLMLLRGILNHAATEPNFE